MVFLSKTKLVEVSLCPLGLSPNLSHCTKVLVKSLRFLNSIISQVRVCVPQEKFQSDPIQSSPWPAFGPVTLKPADWTAPRTPEVWRPGCRPRARTFTTRQEAERSWLSPVRLHRRRSTEGVRRVCVCVCLNISHLQYNLMNYSNTATGCDSHLQTSGPGQPRSGL